MSATLTTTDTETDVQPTATLVMRIPRGFDGGLTDGAKARLEQLSNVTAVTVEQLRGMEPRGGAIYATIDVTLTMTFDTNPDSLETAVRTTLTDSVSVDSIESLSAPHPSPTPTE